jgi:serine/threonine protein kinase
MWSIGVIAYNMLTGIPPFYETTESLTQSKIRLGEFSCKYPNFEHNVSEEGRDFVLALLQVDPAKRLTPEAALKHPWILKASTVPLATKK